MEYKRLIQLDNQYPNLRNYTKNGIDTNILLKGIYYTGEATNQIQFNLADLSKVTPVAGTKFRFILSISMDDSNTNPKLFTSSEFYNDLKSSYDENNPYLPLAGFNKSFIVNLSYFNLLKLFEGYKTLEETDLVFLHKNIFINEKSEIDYDAFANYINWVVDTPNTLDFDSGGVKPAETLGAWSTLTLDPTTGKAVNKKQAQANQQKAAKEAQLKLLNEELAKLIKDISEYEVAIKQGDYPNIGLSRSKVTVAGTEYTSGSHLLNRSKQNDDIKKALQAKLNSLIAKKSEIEKTISELIGAAANTGTQQGTAGNITDASPADLARIQEIDKEIENLKPKANTLLARITGKRKEIQDKINKLEKEKSEIKGKTQSIIKPPAAASEGDSVKNYGGSIKELIKSQ
jgi:hypothetical protein